MTKSFFWVQKYPKSFQNGSPKSTKNRQNPSLDLTGSFLVPSNVPGSSQDRPRVPQDAKVEAPGMPTGTHGHYEPEIGLQKMLRIRHPGANEPAHMTAEELNKTITKQRKPTKPVSHQTDQNLKS